MKELLIIIITLAGMCAGYSLYEEMIPRWFPSVEMLQENIQVDG